MILGDIYFNGFDIAFFAIGAVFAGIGFIRGAVKEIIFLLRFLGLFLLPPVIRPYMELFIIQYCPLVIPDLFIGVIGFVVAAAFLFGMAGLLTFFFKKQEENYANKIVGFIVGMFKYFIIVCVFFLYMDHFISISTRSIFENSYFIGYIGKTNDIMHPYFEKDIENTNKSMRKMKPTAREITDID